ncbi:tripartite tricarboxylate transporter TctB family protein [Oligella urethralis]|uniref:tripartite tricarboxylate transporter TctB family protein n=1 Tax=Oligella urethralis TaxID=90245 RepID=UPI00242AEE23|nr:tripartite tricarboxylate transporter TctB family protein [Oligella urethralis]
MRFKVNRKELWSVLLMLILAVPTIVGSLNYQLGSLARMGPGYFPLILGCVLAFLALLLLFSPEPVESLLDEIVEEDTLSLKEQVITWVTIVASVIAFIVIGKYGGLIPATFVMCTLAAFADKRNSFMTNIIIGAVLTAVAVGLFRYGLQIQFPLFTWG